MELMTLSPRRYTGAARYAKQHNVSIQQMVDAYLLTFQEAPCEEQKTELPERWMKMAGILSGVEKIKGDERLNRILSK